ncbi:MAG: hypothetical protein BWY65_01529 [Firmicutes bacterium ADurb.Bin373]|nr:hypothetical protein [Bacillota bacterium]OQA08311.1 MAG: hypothetical protein BWY65_01529 [Firmicutes bacterium ADurb.Bin373]
MKRDSKDVKLPEELLGKVQGGTGPIVIRSISIIFCQQPGCGWFYDGPAEGASAAQQTHTNATGHNLFGPGVSG